MQKELSQLRESAKQLETAYSDDLMERGLELQYTRNLLKEAQANLALLEKKEAMTKENERLYARMADEYQDKYEREVVDHGRTVEGFCRSNGKLSALNVKLQFAEQQATEHVFKLEECLKNWEHLNEIGEQRIQQLTNKLTDTQSQNKLLLSQLFQLQQEALRAQSETVAQHSEMVEKVHALNLKEKSRTEEEWQERQQELANKNQGLEVERNPTTLTVRSKRRREETTSTSFPSSKRKKV